MHKHILLVILAAIIALILAIALLSLGLTPGKRGFSVVALLAGATQTSTATVTNTPSPTPTRTSTSTPTRTPTPTPTPTPTLFPGQFPRSASAIRQRFLSSWGIDCSMGGQAKAGGYFWDCTWVSGNYLIRTVFFGRSPEIVEFARMYALNVYNPSRGMSGLYLSQILSMTFDEPTAGDLGQWVTTSMDALEGMPDEELSTSIDGFDVALAGPGICWNVTIGDKPQGGIDTDVVGFYSGLEGFCWIPIADWVPDP
jgi:hypothetical protein